MGSSIQIRNVNEDEKSWFNIKRFKIAGLNFNGPIKTLDMKKINRDTYDQLAREAGFQIFETSKTIKFESIQKLVGQSDDHNIGLFFNKKSWLNSPSTVLNFTFDFNPMSARNIVNNIMNGFFDLYYAHSELLMTVPNLRLRSEQGKLPSQSPVTVEQYLEFVDFAFSALDAKNNKPIFVPISLRTSVKDIELICHHYLKHERFNFWIDFEGRAINEQQLGRLRHLYRELKNEGQFENVVCYFTNIKREILSNSNSDKSPASDVLAAVSGANIIGVNREPQRPPQENISEEIVKHKARILDRETYYYNKTVDSNYRQIDINMIHNTIELNKEFQAQTREFEREQTVVNLLKNKEMLKENEKIFKGLTDKHPTMDNWF